MTLQSIPVTHVHVTDKKVKYSRLQGLMFSSGTKNNNWERMLTTFDNIQNNHFT